MEKYAVIVIGAGAGGLVIAIGAARAGKRVLLVERGTWGGDCTNFGCIPSKTLIALAEKHEKREVFEKVRAKVAAVRAHEDAKALQKLGVETRTEEASFLDPHTLQVGKEKIYGEAIVIASGSAPRVPKVYEGVPYLTNEMVFDLDVIPKSLAVIGGGPIGCELAQAFAHLGTEVSLFHRGPHLLKKEEPEAQKVIEERFAQEGIQLHLNCEPQDVQFEGGYFLLDGKVKVEKLLVSVGREANLSKLALDKAGVQSTRAGITVNKYGQTNKRHIWAVGDVNGGPQFTHAAESQARTVLTSLLLPFKKKFSTQPVPRATYTDPEVASFGPLEAEAKERYGEKNLAVYTVPLNENDRAVTANRTEGFVKVITKKMSSRILGATIVAPRAGEMLPELSLAENQKVPLRKLANLIHPYPTYSLAIRRAADLWLTQTFLPWLRHPLRGFNWKRWIPLAVIGILMILAYTFRLDMYLTVDMLKENHTRLKAFVDAHAVISPVIFMAIYMIATALSLPGGALLSLIGGFLFPIPWGTLYVLIGATLGACGIFLAAKTAIGESLKKRAGPFLKKMEVGFQKNAWSYLLFLRFIPLFPFWLVNIAPAFFQVSLLTYLWTTFVGIIPGAYAFTQAGAGLGAILASDEPFSVGAIFNVQIRIAMAAIALISLTPILVKKFFLRKKG